MLGVGFDEYHGGSYDYDNDNAHNASAHNDNDDDHNASAHNDNDNDHNASALNNDSGSHHHDDNDDWCANDDFHDSCSNDKHLAVDNHRSVHDRCGGGRVNDNIDKPAVCPYSGSAGCFHLEFVEFHINHDNSGPGA